LDDAPLAQEHHRINVLLHGPEAGGELFVGGQRVSLSAGDAYVFRPDVEEHEVKMVLRGSRLIWTLGALR
jgi:predicted 2-oxoglutarate/Fe(II)-dependent dioxygenase YbiX